MSEDSSRLCFGIEMSTFVKCTMTLGAVGNYLGRYEKLKYLRVKDIAK